jgi:tetratricopeptide (TPR) repeat protein
MDLERIATALSGRFAVERELGRGGMGVVVLAQDRYLDRRVAIKVLLPEVSRALGLDRFNREIRLTARLVHPNIVPLFDSGQAGESLYYVMPFIDGETLTDRLRGGPRPIAEVVRIGSDVAEALAYAHALGVVHRDLKPDNVFWYGGRALLADFGIATSPNPVADRRTEAGTILGTATYMSPEQATDASRVDARSDLYSLGCFLFELLAGRPPFGGTVLNVVAAHLTAPAPSVATLRPDVPAPLDALVTRLLAKEPADRPSSAALVVEALESISAEPRRTSGRTPAVTDERKLAIAPAELVQACREARSLMARAMQGGDGAVGKLDMARAYIDKARRSFPDHSLALTAQADILYTLAIRGFLPFDETFQEARALWLRALAADDLVGEVHTALGVVFLYWEDDFETAGRELARGVALVPDHAMGRRYYAVWLKAAGRPAEALEHMRAAVRLEPAAGFMHVGLADVLMSLGRYAEAIGPLREALRAQPRYEAALERLEISCHRAGRAEEALDARRMLLGIRGATDRIGILDRETVDLGWPAARDRDVRRDLDDLMAEAERRDPFVDTRTSRQLSDRIVIQLAELGEWAQAMDWVERGYHRRPGRIRRVLADMPYGYQGLATDPRFVRLLRTAGLADLLAWEGRFQRLDQVLGEVDL